jgi:NADP-dependent aldehyde dehydrogenase
MAQGAAESFAAMSPTLFATDAATWKREQKLHEEAFGPGALIIHCDDITDAIDCIDSLQGNLTGTIHLGASDDAADILRHLQSKVGRVVINGYPTGVEVGNAIVHGGPYPATTDPGTTSVGSAAIRRWVRMIAYQDAPEALLPPALQNPNPLGIERVVNGKRTREPIS